MAGRVTGRIGWGTADHDRLQPLGGSPQIFRCAVARHNTTITLLTHAHSGVLIKCLMPAVSAVVETACSDRLGEGGRILCAPARVGEDGSDPRHAKKESTR